MRGLAFVMLLILFGTISYAQWTEPTAGPTQNSEPPLNSSRTNQVRAGALNVYRLGVEGLGFLAPSSNESGTWINNYGVWVGPVQATGANPPVVTSIIPPGGLNVTGRITSKWFCLGDEPLANQIPNTTPIPGCISRWADLSSIVTLNPISGTQNHLVKWLSANTIGDSVITEETSKISIPLYTTINSASGQSGLTFTKLNSSFNPTVSARKVLSIDDSGNVVLVEAACEREGVGAVATVEGSPGIRQWSSIAMSSDGIKQTVVSLEGYIYTSSDSGVTWTERMRGTSDLNWNSILLRSIAMSSDGTKQTVVSSKGHIYTSSDSGVTWTERMGSTSNLDANLWRNIAMSSDGTKQTVVGTRGIYTSSDFGSTWTKRRDDIAPNDIAMSSDGTKQTVVGNYGLINNGRTDPGAFLGVSSDSGVTWEHANFSSDELHYGGNMYFSSIAISSNGNNKMAVTNFGVVYVTDGSYVDAFRRTWRMAGNLFSINNSVAVNGLFPVAMSSDGTKQTIVGGFNNKAFIYTSSNFGTTWLQRRDVGINFLSNDIAMSSDGTKQTAVFHLGGIYTSSDSGGTWVKR